MFTYLIAVAVVSTLGLIHLAVSKPARAEYSKRVRVDNAYRALKSFNDQVGLSTYMTDELIDEQIMLYREIEDAKSM